MQVDVPESLAELLLMWWAAESRGTVTLGYPTECPSTRGYCSRSRLWDEDHADQVHASAIVQRVSSAIDRLEPAERSAVHVLTRNLATGVEVWRSARIPEGPAGQAVFVAAVARLNRDLAPLMA